jgi:hypothetical protein
MEKATRAIALVAFEVWIGSGALVATTVGENANQANRNSRDMDRLFLRHHTERQPGLAAKYASALTGNDHLQTQFISKQAAMRTRMYASLRRNGNLYIRNPRLSRLVHIDHRYSVSPN